MSTIFKALRKRAGVTQAALAKKAGLYQANISEIENGLIDPSFSTVERYIAQLGYQLVPVPTRIPTVFDFCLHINEDIAIAREDWAFRSIIQLNDNLTQAEPEVANALAALPPQSVGDKRFDALIAGVVQYRLESKKLPVPGWVNREDRILSEWWTVDKKANKFDDLENTTPACFKSRRILLAESELQSV
jgi:transcriptional regulator with XRE-family HTH domain